MATGSSDHETVGPEWVPDLRDAVRRLLAALVVAPGRSTAMLLVVVPYLWLLHYLATTAAGVRPDPIVGGDWLTLVFTTYALFSALALAHRILRIGLLELTEEYLLDAVVLTWLTAFYFVWMLAREPVQKSTSPEELYGPVIAGEPGMMLPAVLLGVTAVVVVGLIYRPRAKSKLFCTEFRTAVVTLPALVTAGVLLFDPGANSTAWSLVGGVFVGTIVGGLTRIQPVISGIAKGVFVLGSLLVWAFGAAGWMIVYRRRPPNTHVVLSHVQFGGNPTRQSESKTVEARPAGTEVERSAKGDDESATERREEPTSDSATSDISSPEETLPEE